MEHIKKIGIILLIIGAGIYVIFFSAEEYQNNPDYFLINKDASIKSSVVTLEKKFHDEYQMALYLYKTKRYEEAYNHFYNVYHRYPTIPKSQIHLDAQMYMILCSKRIEEK
ncbi:MAG TPA: hypothetical protein PLJ38_09605, partial [bacterium]|nr:hypothetical protein [bacterium]